MVSRFSINLLVKFNVKIESSESAEDDAEVRLNKKMRSEMFANALGMLLLGLDPNVSGVAVTDVSSEPCVPVETTQRFPRHGRITMISPEEFKDRKGDFSTSP